MANERMYLYCKHCGARLYMGKHSYGVMHFSSYDVMNNFGKKLQKFYEDHHFCPGNSEENCFLYDTDYFEDEDPRYDTDYAEVYDFGIVYESSSVYSELYKFNKTEIY